jgi:hypothetical protein
MSIIATALPSSAVSPEVWAFAEQQGVAAYLPAVLAMTQRIFPTWPLKVFLEDDPEIADDRHIVLEVQTPEDATAEALVALDEQWVEEIFACCPSTHVCIFRLGMA